MKVYLNKITGIDDAITSMYMSKRTWTRELEESIRNAAHFCTDRAGGLIAPDDTEYGKQMHEFFIKELNKVTKWGKRHMSVSFFLKMPSFFKAGICDFL